VIARPPLALPLLALAAFGGLLLLVAVHATPLDRADSAVSEAFRSYGLAHPGVVSVARVATSVMSTVSFLSLGCAATVLLAWRSGRRAAGFCAAVTVAVPVLWGILHAWLHRPRPVGGFVTVASNGFPSGHTSHAAATGLAALLLLWPRLRRGWRAVLVLAAVVLAVGVGLTRVVLLAHWPSDVLGGILLALAVVPLLAALFPPAAAPVTAPSPVPRTGGRPLD
jgi:membrane-associated phospholipid phosphatase